MVQLYSGVKMATPDLTLIDDIRAASRQMVRELGFLEQTLAATDYPPSAVHAILEIGARGPMTSGRLADLLHLEKSSVSRMVRKLIECGEVREQPDAEDARIKPLSLTAKGQRTLATIEEFARRQVSSALERLTETERRTVHAGLAIYARALSADRVAEADSALRRA
jgi:DNA-binding MarR family transcriptional regulator